MSLSDDFTEVRRKVNTEITDERVIAHCHTCINQLDNKTKEKIKELENELELQQVPKRTIYLILKQVFGKELCSKEKSE